MARIAGCLVVMALLPAVPAAAANVPADSGVDTSALGSGRVGDIAPYSLETGGSDYTRAYIPNRPQPTAAPTQPPAAADLPLPP